MISCPGEREALRQQEDNHTLPPLLPASVFLLPLSDDRVHEADRKKDVSVMNTYRGPRVLMSLKLN